MNHSGMIGSVIVMEPREFDNWLSGNTGSRRRPSPVSNCTKRSVVLRVTEQMVKVDVAQRWRACSARQVSLTNGQTVSRR